MNTSRCANVRLLPENRKGLEAICRATDHSLNKQANLAVTWFIAAYNRKPKVSMRPQLERRSTK